MLDSAPPGVAVTIVCLRLEMNLNIPVSTCLKQAGLQRILCSVVQLGKINCCCMFK